ncbi:POTRA domain-containing protein [Aridibaculum aurantiacum]|uniref:POTRA domain-containing protein n=1 Tax=Aridibaculum aurantiacum TaxID=2810307 RepID=UPI001A957195|nr:POTRA domain-containing protein [Aridibaculum aurantiacum]
MLVYLSFICVVQNLYAQQDSTSIEKTASILPAAEADSLGSLVMVGNITILGYKKTKEYIIQREIPFKQGDYMLKSTLKEKLELARQQLMNTTLFVDVEVTAKYAEEVAFVQVVVKERWYLFPLPYFKIVGRNFNDWWVEHNRSLQRVNYGIKFMQNNVSGRNDHLNFALVAGYTQQVYIRYENPFIEKSLKHGMSIGVSYNRNREVNYADSMNKQLFVRNPDAFLNRSFHIDVGYSYRPAIKTRHHFRVQYNDVEIDDTILEKNPAYHPEGRKRIKYSGFSYSIQHFDVDYIPYPTRGFMGDAYASTRFSKDFLGQIGFRGTFTKEVFTTSYLQFQAAGLLKMPFNQAYYSLGMFGSADFYMRGLEPYVIQGVFGGVARATAIKKVLAFNIKNPINTKTHDKIPFRFMLKAYGDVGYAHLPNRYVGNSMLNNKILRTWGAGVDILSIYDMVLKIEYSFNQLGERGFFIHTAADF